MYESSLIHLQIELSNGLSFGDIFAGGYFVQSYYKLARIVSTFQIPRLCRQGPNNIL